MPLVHHVVGTMLPRLPPNVLRDDLIAAGTFGSSTRSAARRRSERGAEFEWYARVRIRGAIIDELRSHDWLSRRARRRFASDERTTRAPRSSASRIFPEERRTHRRRSALTPEPLVAARSDAQSPSRRPSSRCRSASATSSRRTTSKACSSAPSRRTSASASPACRSSTRAPSPASARCCAKRAVRRRARLSAT